MSIITLITDFGIEDAYVGVMKGVALSINSSATFVDITHHVNPQDIVQAAYLIKSSYKYFPEGTVHMIVVDPGVGSERPIIALEMKGQFFLAPDNGVLTLLMDEGKIDSLARVENKRFFLKTISQTFHGRDIFAPVSANISKGIKIKELGPPLDRQELVHLTIQKPYTSKQGELVGTVVSIDHFGNITTNIDEPCLKKFYITNQVKKLEIFIGKNRIKGLSNSYSSVKRHHPLAIIGSFGYLEIALNQGNAGRYFEAKKGDTIFIKDLQEIHREE
jgi:S-adenosylmethionine hydrolase